MIVQMQPYNTLIFDYMVLRQMANANEKECPDSWRRRKMHPLVNHSLKKNNNQLFFLL